MTQHDHLEESIKKLDNVTSRHSGQWFVLLTVMAGIGAGLIFMHSQYTKRLDQIINSQTFMTEYISYHRAESEAGFLRIGRIESAIDDHEKRLDILESSH